MGVVFLAQAPGDQRVAVKILRPSIVGDANGRARLAREVTSLRRVRSPRIAEVYDADPWGETPYVVMRYVPGPSLREVVDHRGPLTGQALLRFARGLAQALVVVHRADVLHRDVKPSNVLIQEGEPVLIDFGLAQLSDDMTLTQVGWLLGTPGYLAPEILYGDGPTPAADVHAWAATVTFAAIGRGPYGTGPAMVIMDRARRGDVNLDGVPTGLDDVLAAALRADPANRPTARQLVDWLDSRRGRALAPASVPSPAVEGQTRLAAVGPRSGSRASERPAAAVPAAPPMAAPSVAAPPVAVPPLPAPSLAASPLATSPLATSPLAASSLAAPSVAATSPGSEVSTGPDLGRYRRSRLLGHHAARGDGRDRGCSRGDVVLGAGRRLGAADPVVRSGLTAGPSGRPRTAGVGRRVLCPAHPVVRAQGFVRESGQRGVRCCVLEWFCRSRSLRADGGRDAGPGDCRPDRVPGRMEGTAQPRRPAGRTAGSTDNLPRSGLATAVILVLMLAGASGLWAEQQVSGTNYAPFAG